MFERTRINACLKIIWETTFMPKRIAVRILLLIACAFNSLGASAAEVAKVRIGLQYGLTYLPVVVAQSAGLFDKSAKAQGLPGLEVELNRFSGSTAMNEALLSNSIDFGTLGTAGALIAWDKTRGRQQIKSIGALTSITYALYTNRPNIKSLADFTPNEKIAVPAFNSPQAILLRVAAAKAFGDAAKADALMISLPHPDATAALLSGQVIGGYFATPPFIQILEKDKRVHEVLKSSSLTGGSNITGATLAGMQNFVDANPRVAQAMLTGLEDAAKLIRDDPKRAAEIYLASEKVQLGVEEVQRILSDGSMTFSASPEGIEAFAQFMLEQGMLTKLPGSWKDVFFPMIGDRKGS
jgi:NitT/TauT family transport system substrate-binding protein